MLLVGAGSAAYQLLEPLHTKQAHQEDKQEEKNLYVPPFPQLNYRGKLITNAREAYSALYHSVFNGISKDDEYRVLYRALNDYGGEYAAMAAYLEVNFNQGQE